MEASGVPEFVADVGGEFLGLFHPFPERKRHPAQRSGEVADFILAPAQVLDFHPAVTGTNALGRSRKGPQRPRYAARQIDRKQDGCDQRHAGGREDIQPDLAYRLVDSAAVGGNHRRAHHTLKAPDRQGDAQHQAARAERADDLSRLPAQRPLNLAIVGGLLFRMLHIRLYGFQLLEGQVENSQHPAQHGMEEVRLVGRG